MEHLAARKLDLNDIGVCGVELSDAVPFAGMFFSVLNRSAFASSKLPGMVLLGKGWPGVKAYCP